METKADILRKENEIEEAIKIDLSIIPCPCCKKHHFLVIKNNQIIDTGKSLLALYHKYKREGYNIKK